VRNALQKRGALVQLHDPLYSDDEIRALGFVPGSMAAAAPAPELIVLVTAHRAFATIDFAELARRGLEAVIDGRNFFDADRVAAADVSYFGVGCRSVLQPTARGAQ
jgi:UDP-N-acetyl-D-mannosaminuronate dehydrogenase